MNTRNGRVFRALLMREWVLMRAWVLGFLLVTVGGPVINLLNAIGGNGETRIMAAFASIYSSQFGTLNVLGNRLMNVDYNHPVPVFIHGAPHASMWVIAVAMVMGTLASTVDRQGASVTELFSGPVRRKDWVRAKFSFGLTSILAFVLARTSVVLATDAVSPWHFAFSTVCLAGLVNLSIALVSFAGCFFVGLFVGNAIVAWCMGFLGLSLPLALGAVVRFLGFTSGMARTAYTWEHSFLLWLSPFSYTQYNTVTAQHFAYIHQLANHHVVVGPMTSVTMDTVIHHPWWLFVGSCLACAVLYLASRWAFSRARTESLAEMVVSRRALHGNLTLISIVFGAAVAEVIQGFGSMDLMGFLIAAVLTYMIVWFGYRQVERLTSKATNRRRARWHEDLPIPR